MRWERIPPWQFRYATVAVLSVQTNKGLPVPVHGPKAACPWQTSPQSDSEVSVVTTTCLDTHSRGTPACRNVQASRLRTRGTNGITSRVPGVGGLWPGRVGSTTLEDPASQRNHGEWYSGTPTLLQGPIAQEVGDGKGRWASSRLITLTCLFAQSHGSRTCIYQGRHSTYSSCNIESHKRCQGMTGEKKLPFAARERAIGRLA